MLSRIICYLFVVILSVYPLVSKNLIIHSDSNGVRIEIRNLSARYIQTDTSIKLALDNIRESESKTFNAVSLDVISFQLALPDNYTVNEFFNDPQKILSIPSGINTPKLEPFAKISFIGIKRGVRLYNIQISPYYLDTQKSDLFLAQSVLVEIRFSKELTLNPNLRNDEYNLSFFSGLKNIEMVPALLSSTNDKKDNQPLASYWYDPAQDYLKVTTKKDGIAKISAMDLIAIKSNLKNKKSKYLHLLSNGLEVPIYFSNDPDGTLNGDETIYFFGKRASGDTTWFDNFTDKASFYLYFDESNEGKRYIKSELTTSNIEINKVNISKHIEKDVIYDVGFPQDFSEIMPGEGWCWEILSPNEGSVTHKKFSDYVFLNPTENSEDSIEVGVYYASSRWDPTIPINHNLSFVINQDSIDKRKLTGSDKGLFIYKSSNQNHHSGLNLLEVISNGFRKPNGDYYLPDETIIDYITVQGQSKVYASSGVEEFSIPKLLDNSFLNIPNFRSEAIIGLDTVNSRIYFPQSVRGVSCVIGSDFKNNFSSVIVNNNSFSSEFKDGILMVSANPLKSTETNSKFYYASNINDLENDLTALTDGTFIGISLNSRNISVPQKIKSILTSLGSKLIQNVNPSNSWSFAAIKGNPETSFEKFSADGCSNISGFINLQSGISYNAKVYLPANEQINLFISDSLNYENAAVQKVNSTNLRDLNNKYQYLILTHSDFKKVAERLKSHRDTTDPNIKSIVIDVEDIYKEFLSGKTSPHAIKNFLKYTYNNWLKPAPMYVVLIGDACYDAKGILKSTKMKDYIPTYGWPASDYWYTTIDGDDQIADLSLGRLPVTSEKQGMGYIDKLEEYDSMPNNPWTKKFLGLSGGNDVSERAMMYETVRYTLFDDLLNGSDVGAQTYVIGKKDPAVGGETEASEIISRINNGEYWVSFFGHGSPTILDMDGWQADKLNNKGKYGFLSTISCNTADYANTETQSRNEDYILEPMKAFIGAGGSSNFSLKDVNIKLQYWVLKGLSNPLLKFSTYLDLLNYAKSNTLNNDAEILISQQYCYLGEPLIKLRNIGDPDLYFVTDGSDIKISSNTSNNMITEEDSSLTITGKVYNQGYRTYNKTKVKLVHKYENGIEYYEQKYDGLLADADFKFIIPIFKKPGIHTFELIADPDSTLSDPNRTNNSYRFNLQVFTLGLYPVEPLSNWNVDFNSPQFRFINPSYNQNENTFSYDFKVFDETNNELILSSKDDEIIVSETHLDWKPKLKLKESKRYFVNAVLKNLSTGKVSASLVIPFHTTNAKIENKVDYQIYDSTQLSKVISENLFVNQSDSIFRLEPANKLHPFNIISVRGGTERSPFRTSWIQYDGGYYITTPPDLLGFKVVHISSKDHQVKDVKIYDTWGLDDAMKDSSSVKLVEFLKDSIPEGDYALIAIHGESTRLPQIWKENAPESNGSFDSLRAILKRYGSTFADSISWASSFAIAGRKGAIPGSVPENWNKAGDSSIIIGNLIEYNKIGSVKTSLIGPAKKWIDFSVSGKFFNDSNNRIKVWGRDSRGNSTKLFETYDIKDLNLNSIISDYLWFEISIGKADEKINPFIDKITCTFVPTEEFSIIKSKCFIHQDSVMRGDTSKLIISLENISKRIKSEENTASINIGSNSGIIEKLIADIPVLNSDSSISFESTFITDNLSSGNYISVIQNEKDSPKELYSFNNTFSTSLFVTPDLIKPEIKLFLDSIEVKNGDFVTRQPKVNIDILDNSRLPISKATKTDVYINGRWQDHSKMDFSTFERNVPLKARLSFISDSLEYGDNIFRIYASDASGNRDTLIVSVNVSLNWFIQNPVSLPNPANDHTSLEYYLKAPKSGSLSKISVYNQLGQKIIEFNQTAVIGKNKVEWNLRDQDRNSIPTGLYTFLIQIITDDYVEPVTGKLLIIK